MRHNQQDTTQWCAGLPLTEERWFHREERAELERMIRSLLTKGFITFLIATVGGIALFRMFFALRYTYDWALIGISVMFFFLLFAPLASLFSEGSWFYRGLLLWRDLRRGFVKVFSGQPTEIDQADQWKWENPAGQRHRRSVAREVPAFDDGTLMLEILPISRFIWQENGQRVVCWVRVAWKDVAKPPEAALWLHARNENGRRRMSERERAELFREARKQWQSPAAAALIGSMFFVAVVVEAVTSRLTLKSVPKWGGDFHIIWLALAADVFAVRRWQEARRMFRDARQGEVEILAPEDETSGCSERLPISGRLWTQSGRPAAWRQMRN